MTLSTTANREQYNGDGSNKDFPYSFLVLEADHLQVFVDNVLVTNYIVTGLKNPAGGLVQFDSAPPTGTGNVVILRQVPVVQETDYEEYDPFPAETHEGALDYLTMIDQQQQEELDRTVKYDPLQVDPAPFTVRFGSAVERAGKIWAFDDTGNVVVTIDTAEDKAYRWAEEDEDQIVEFRAGRNRFSAYHWAQKAEAIVDLPFQNEGDLLTGVAGGSVSILPVGLTDGMVLTVDSEEDRGLKWLLQPTLLPGLDPGGTDKLKVLHVQPDGQAYELTGAYSEQIIHGKDFLEDDESTGDISAEAGVPHYGNVAMKFTKPGISTPVVGWLNGVILRRHDVVDYGMSLRFARSVGDVNTIPANVKFQATAFLYNFGQGLGGSNPPVSNTVIATAVAVPSEEGPGGSIDFPTLFPKGGDTDILCSVKIERLDNPEDTFLGEVDVYVASVEDE